MKIIHILFGFTYGGIETMLVNIVNEQSKYAEVHIILINNHFNPTLVNKICPEVEFIRINRPPGSKNPFYILKMNWLISRLSPNVIHTHSSDIIRYLLPHFRQRAVNTVHETPNHTHFPYLKYYRKVFAISKSVHTVLKAKGYNSIVVENGIRPDSFLKKQTSPNSIFKIVQVGRLEHHKKGHDLTIKACATLVRQGIHNFHVDFIGEGNSQAYLEELVVKNKLEPYITFLGNKDTIYIETHLKDYHLLVQPSRIEGFGLTVAEAMAARVPVLVSGQEGPMEIIDDGRYGYHFKNEDLEEMVNKIKFIMNLETKELNELTEKAFLRIQECYDIRKTVMKYLQEYGKED